MNQATLLRESRSKHTLKSYADAVQQFRAFREVLYYKEELGVFRSYAEEAGLFFTTPPDELNRTPDEKGNEHQVWYLPNGELVL